MPPTSGALEPIDDDRTMLTTGADDLDLLVFHLVGLGVDFVVHEPAALRDEIGRVGRRLVAAAAVDAAGALWSTRDAGNEL